jgi:acetyl-CoA carboxylase carboxyltransferase component
LFVAVKGPMTETVKKDLRAFIVWHEKGGFVHVLASDEEDAIEQFYEAISSMIGHTLKICGCFGEEKPLDRSKVIRPIKVEEWNEESVNRKLLKRS